MLYTFSCSLLAVICHIPPPGKNPDRPGTQTGKRAGFEKNWPGIRSKKNISTIHGCRLGCGGARSLNSAAKERSLLCFLSLLKVLPDNLPADTLEQRCKRSYSDTGVIAQSYPCSIMKSGNFCGGQKTLEGLLEIETTDKLPHCSSQPLWCSGTWVIHQEAGRLKKNTTLVMSFLEQLQFHCCFVYQSYKKVAALNYMNPSLTEIMKEDCGP
jgi:hypothetical protein